MKNYSIQAFKILAHPSRLAILNILRDGEQCVCHLEAALGLRQAHISQQLMILREAGWVEDRRDGWNIFYRVCKPEIYQVIDAMDAFSGIKNEISHQLSLTNKHNCPCPKCNSLGEAPKLELRNSSK